MSLTYFRKLACVAGVSSVGPGPFEGMYPGARAAVGDPMSIDTSGMPDPDKLHFDQSAYDRWAAGPSLGEAPRASRLKRLGKALKNPLVWGPAAAGAAAGAGYGGLKAYEQMTAEDTPWYKTPMGIGGIAASGIGGAALLAYLLNKDREEERYAEPKLAEDAATAEAAEAAADAKANTGIEQDVARPESTVAPAISSGQGLPWGDYAVGVGGAAGLGGAGYGAYRALKIPKFRRAGALGAGIGTAAAIPAVAGYTLGRSTSNAPAPQGGIGNIWSNLSDAEMYALAGGGALAGGTGLYGLYKLLFDRDDER